MCFNTAVSRIPHLVLSSALLAAPAFAQQPKSIGELFASDASVRGSVVLASSGTTILSGSQVVTGDAPAVLKLSRGGELRICARTELAMSSSSPSDQILVGLNTGNVEAHYSLGAAADALVTPDFRIQLTGPGEFHVAIGSDARGNTCVRSLKGNTSAVIVSEMLGTGTYQVKAGDAVEFRAGHITGAIPLAFECGCPAPKPVLQASTPERLPDPVAINAAATQPQPENGVPEQHMEVEAPFVFRGDEAPPEFTLANVSIRSNSTLALALQPKGQLVSAKKTNEKRGFFGNIGRFFSRMFKG